MAPLWPVVLLLCMALNALDGMLAQKRQIQSRLSAVLNELGDVLADTFLYLPLVLMSLFPLRQLRRLRPVAAANYFMTTPLLAWFATQMIGIIPIQRNNHAGHQDPLAEAHAALDRGDIVIIFPKVTRGEPERMQQFKSSVIHLAKAQATTPIIPVFLHGLGMALSKGEGLLMPFFCDVFVGPPLQWAGDRQALMQQLTQQMESLSAEKGDASWD